MTKCDYLILEYTDSELRAHGTPFIVLLRKQLQNSSTLSGYVLRGWETKIKVASDKELDDVEIILDDLRSCRNAIVSSSSTHLFNRLSGLGIGPVRERVSGSCHLEELDTVLPLFFEEEITTTPWHVYFDELGTTVGSVVS